MKKTIHRLCAVFGLICLTACTTITDNTAAEPHSLVVISMDGFRPDYLGKGRTPNLDRIAAEGVSTPWITPSYPTLTFPNHTTLITGLRPDHHGIVHNYMTVKELGSFAPANLEAVSNPAWWPAQPLWAAANEAGWPTASMMWPGSIAPIKGGMPTRRVHFDRDMAYSERMRVVGGWLSEPMASRPRLVTVYLDHVDHEAHGNGPFSDDALGAVAETDRAIGQLMETLRASKRLATTNIVIVSDHGMSEVPALNHIVVDSMVPMHVAKIHSVGQVITIQPNPGHEKEARNILLGRHEHYECFEKTSLPSRWKYGTHARVTPIVCQMDKGWDAILRKTSEQRKRNPHMYGSHGYEPTDPEMRATFMAIGPDFAKRTILKPFENVDVYPLLRHVLKLPPEQRDGTLENVKDALAQ